MTSSAYVWEPCFRARIKNVQSAYQNAYEFFQKFMGEALVSGFGTKQPLQQLKFLLLWLLCQWLYYKNKIGGKILLTNQNHFSGFYFFKKKRTKRRTGNDIWKLCWWNSCYSSWNSYWLLFYVVLAGNNDPFRVTPSTSSELYRYSVSGGPALITVLVF